MTPEETDIARRLVACKQFTANGQMQWVDPDTGETVYGPFRDWHPSSPYVLDLCNWGNVGCLLGMVKADPDSEAHFWLVSYDAYDVTGPALARLLLEVWDG